MAGSVSGLVTFGTQVGPIATSTLDTNFTALTTAVNSANTYSNYLTDSGSANNIVVSVPSPSTATLAAGLTLTIKVAQTNTGPTTLNLNAGGAVGVIDAFGNTLSSNELVGGSIFTFVYNGTKWQIVGGSGAGGSLSTSYADTFTCTAGQTSFTLSANPNGINNLTVSLDGAVLVANIDYTWTGGTTLTLTTGAKVGQTLFVRYLEGFVVANVTATTVTYTQGGTGSTSRTVTAKLQESVSVKDFGAVGDGVTNDAPAFNAAFASGYPVYIPKATYAIGAALTISNPVVVYGNGATLIRTFQSTYVTTLTISGSNVVIHDLNMNGNRAGFVTNGWTLGQFQGCYLITGSNVTLSNCTGNNAVGDGVSVDLGANEVLIEGCTFDNAYRNGGSVVRATNVYIVGCTFSNANGISPQAGLDIEPSYATDNNNRVYIIGCSMFGNINFGASVNHSTTPTGVQQDIHFSHCDMYSNGTGLNLITAYSVKAVDCDMRNNTYSGVSVSGTVSDIQIIGGMIRSNGTRGFAMILGAGFTATDVVLNGVTIKDNSATTAGAITAVQVAGPGTTTGLAIVNCRIGNQGTSNQPFGISTDSSVSNLRLIGNDLSNNANGATLLGDSETTRISQSNRFGASYGQAGTFTCSAAASTTITNGNVTAACKILLTPTNAAAATLQGSAKCLYVSARTSGTSFVVTTASGVAAAGTETFDYYILSNGN